MYSFRDLPLNATNPSSPLACHPASGIIFDRLLVSELNRCGRAKHAIAGAAGDCDMTNRRCHSGKVTNSSSVATSLERIEEAT